MITEPAFLDEREWQSLLREIHRGQVIPVVGPTLVTVDDQQTGEAIPLVRYLAPLLAKELGTDTPGPEDTLSSVARQFLLSGGKRRALAIATQFVILFLISILAGPYGWSQARHAREQTAAAMHLEEVAEAERDAARQARYLAELARQDALTQKETAEQMAENLEATLARSDYFLAVACWKEHRAGDAQQFLRPVPPKYRNFEWYHDNGLFQGGYMTLYGHQSSVKSVAFSPDGTRIASGSRDNTIKLWDAASGQELRTLQGQTVVTSVAFSPDGTRIASGGEDNTIKLWDAASGQELRTLVGHMYSVESVAFSPDGTRIASGSDDRTIKLWDAASGQELRTFDGHKHIVMSVVFSPDGTRIASGSLDNTIKLWDAASGQELCTLQGHSERIISVAFSPDGTQIASRDVGGVQFVWDSATGEKIDAVGGAEWNQSQTCSPDGRWLAVPLGDNVGLVDLEFKHTPQEKALREMKARLDPWWHLKQAESAEKNDNWYATTFHRAWVIESMARIGRSDDERLADAPAKLRHAYSQWRESLDTSANNELPDPNLLLQPTVLEVLKSIEVNK